MQVSLGEQRAAADDVPEWSGGFWSHDEFGYLQIHCADTRMHHPPAGEGWRFVRTIPAVDEDAQILLYRKISHACSDERCWDYL